MCCDNLPEAAEALLASYKRRQWMSFWKVVSREGKTWCLGYPCTPGLHTVKTRRKHYEEEYPFGFHVYRTKARAHHVRQSTERVLRVFCHRDDLLAADDTEAVFRRMKVLPSDFKKAGCKE